MIVSKYVRTSHANYLMSLGGLDIKAGASLFLYIFKGKVFMIYRHGDVILKTISKIPSGAKVTSSGKLNKLALGETTGHSHKLMTVVDVDLLEFGGNKYFSLPEPATIEHEEHKTLTLEPQVYEVVIKKEFDYITKQIREVKD